MGVYEWPYTYDQIAKFFEIYLTSNTRIIFIDEILRTEIGLDWRTASILWQGFDMGFEKGILYEKSE